MAWATEPVSMNATADMTVPIARLVARPLVEERAPYPLESGARIVR